MTSKPEPSEQADAEQPPEEEIQLTRRERRMRGKQPQQQFGVAPVKGKGAIVPSRRQYSNRRSG
jgi:hypothetical protein